MSIPYQSVNVFDGYVKLLDYMGGDIDIVSGARISTNSQSKGEEQDKKLIRYLMINSHTSPFELVEFKFEVMAPLFIVAQWQRHRTWSYQQKSMRYTSNDIKFYTPRIWRRQAEDNKQASIMEAVRDNDFLDILHEQHMKDSVELYNMMLDAGVARELARIELPQALYTTFIAKVDAHNLMNFIRLRYENHAQWEIQQYAYALLQFMNEVIPWTTEAFMEKNGIKI